MKTIQHVQAALEVRDICDHTFVFTMTPKGRKKFATEACLPYELVKEYFHDLRKLEKQRATAFDRGIFFEEDEDPTDDS